MVPRYLLHELHPCDATPHPHMLDGGSPLRAAFMFSCCTIHVAQVNAHFSCTSLMRHPLQANALPLWNVQQGVDRVRLNALSMYTCSW